MSITAKEVNKQHSGDRASDRSRTHESGSVTAAGSAMVTDEPSDVAESLMTPLVLAEPGSNRVVTTSYVFATPRREVFSAYTDPALIPRWWTERPGLEVAEMDVRPGGGWRFVDTGSDAQEVFRGVYHLVDAPERLVTTWSYDPLPGVFLQTVTFEPVAGDRTKVTHEVVVASVEDREMMSCLGMDRRALDMLRRLDQLLSSL